MPLASYNPGSPAGMDQWSIENTLAPLAVGGSQSEAQMMLGNYQNERAAANSQYASNLDQEHLFAYQQLAQQMKEAYLKETPNYAKEGLLPVLMGTNPAALAGADPAALDLANRQYYETAAAKNFQAGATGLNQASQGGYQVNPALAPGVAGTTVGPYRGPALAQAATIRGQFGLAAANARGTQEGRTTVQTTLPIDASGVGHSISTPKVGPDNVQSTIERHNGIAQGILQGRSGGSGSSLPPAPGNTSAAPAGGGGGQGGVPTRLDTSSQQGAQAQGIATKLADQLAKNPATKAQSDDMRAGMEGNTYRIFRAPTGQTFIAGKTQAHILPGS